MNKFLSFLACLLILVSCSPKITTSISKNYGALSYEEEVRVLSIQDTEPNNAELLGTVKIGDAGFTIDCNLSVVVDKAKIEARKIGGNAIKITKHSPPNFWGSSCHRITANILKVDNWNNYIAVTADSALIDADYALLHVYRHSGGGVLVNYDLHLGDTVICRAQNKWKETVKIHKDGLNTLWARTEAKAEIPINIKFGNEYYIRCSLTTGFLVGHPQLELVENTIGRMEFQSIPEKKQ
ncbi:MAG: hypothetical protein LBJ63_01690 [Prevotellaceae bacterium]|jgi:hypothetical protein|nr:hypothetical protein [Prevotellaceae bacterium]